MKNFLHRILLIGRPQSKQAAETVRSIAEWLEQKGLAVCLEHETAKSLGTHRFQTSKLKPAHPSWDLAITVGGDGTLLGAARDLAPSNALLLGINHGRLGFVTDISLENWKDTLLEVFSGNYTTEERSLLATHVVRKQNTVWTEFALNDIVVSRSTGTGMIEVQVHVDDTYMYRQRADGLIIATPTGSTAYALSSNGPILHPQTKGIVLVPIAPQALSNRPIVIPDMCTITVRVLDGESARVSGDMQVFSDLHIGDDIIIACAPFKARFLHPPGYSYFGTLRNKLNWQELPLLMKQTPS